MAAIRSMPPLSCFGFQSGRFGAISALNHKPRECVLIRRRKNYKPQEFQMKIVLHATEPPSSQNPLPQLIEYDLAELISGIEALRVPAATGRTKLWWAT